MTGPGQPEQPTELVYLPRASWSPIFVALGIACLVLGVFLGWLLLLGGAVVTIVAAGTWVGGATRDYLRLPRRQRARPAVLPPITVGQRERD